MKISLSQLRNIIKETVEEVGMTEIDEPVSPEEFELIVTESKIRLPLREDFGILTVSLGTILGILAYKAGKYAVSRANQAVAVAAVEAVKVADELSREAQEELRRKAAAAARSNLDAAVASLANDPQLAKMFQSLRMLKDAGATRREVDALSKEITNYVRQNMTQTGASTMDVRRALGTRF